MSGRVIRILPLTHYDLSNLAVGGSTALLVADRIDASQFTMATLMVRRHSGDVGDGAGDAEVKVFARASGYTEQEPDKTFGASTDLAAIAITGTFSEPEYQTAELTAGQMGAMVLVGIEVTQDSNQQKTIDPTLSIDLALKE